MRKRAHPLVSKLLLVTWRAEWTIAVKVLYRKKTKMQIFWVSLGCLVMKYSLLGWFNIFLVCFWVCIDDSSVSHLFLSFLVGSYCLRIYAMLQVRPFLIWICKNNRSTWSKSSRTWNTSCSLILLRKTVVDFILFYFCYFLNDLDNLDLTTSCHIWRMLW